VDEISTDGDATLRFMALAAKTYTIEYTDALESGVWMKLVDLPALESDHLETVVDPDTGPGRYYRIVTPRQP
jgi:hypothetical protein